MNCLTDDKTSHNMSIVSYCIRWNSQSLLHVNCVIWRIYSTDRSKAVVPVLVSLFVALWFILRGDLFYVLPCVILFLCFTVLLALRLPRLGKRELVLVLFVRLRLFGFVCFLFLLVSGKGLRFVIVALPGLFSYPPHTFFYIYILRIFQYLRE